MNASRAYLLALILSGCLSTATATELSKFVEDALFQQNDKGLWSWAFYANQESPIDWLTNGVSSGKREGTAKFTVDKFLPKILKDNVSDGFWGVTLKGTKFGAQMITLHMDSCWGTASMSPNCMEEISKYKATLESRKIEFSPICDFGGSSHNVVYRITHPDTTEYLYLRETYDNSSGGATLSLDLIPRSNKKDSNLRHDSIVCGLFFKRYGGVSSTAYSYLSGEL